MLRRVVQNAVQRRMSPAAIVSSRLYSSLKAGKGRKFVVNEKKKDWDLHDKQYTKEEINNLAKEEEVSWRSLQRGTDTREAQREEEAAEYYRQQPEQKIRRDYYDAEDEQFRAIDELAKQQREKQKQMEQDRLGDPEGMELNMDSPIPEGALTTEHVERMETKANIEGDVECMLMLGVMYWHGHGVQVDLSKAESYLKRASRKGNFPAMLQLSHLWMSEERNMEKAFELLTRIEAQCTDDPETLGNALESIGHMHHQGVNRKQDEALGWVYFHRAAELDSMYACQVVSAKLLNLVDQRGPHALLAHQMTNPNSESTQFYDASTGFYTGPRMHISPATKEDADKGMRYLTKAAEAGDVNSCCFVMCAYNPHTADVSPYVQKDLGLYYSMAALAAEFMEINAMIVWGRAQFYGLDGVAVNQAVGAELIKKAHKIYKGRNEAALRAETNAQRDNMNSQEDDGESNYYEKEQVEHMLDFMREFPDDAMGDLQEKLNQQTGK